MRFRRNFLIAFLFALLCAVCVSCGNDADDDNIYTHQFRFIAELPSYDESGQFENKLQYFMTPDEQFCMLVSGERARPETDETDDDYSVPFVNYPTNYILKSDQTGENVTVTELESLDEAEADILGRSSGIYFDGVVGLSDGGYLCYGSIPIFAIINQEEPEKTDLGRRFVKYTSDGKIEKFARTVDIDPDLNMSVIENGKYVWFLYSDDRIYFLTADGKIFILDENINLVSKFTLPDEERDAVINNDMNYPVLLTSDKDGTPIFGCGITTNAQTKYVCYPINENGLGEPLETPDTGSKKPILANGYDVYYSDSIGLYAMNSGDKEPEKLFRWVDIDLSYYDISFLKIIDPEKMFVITKNGNVGIIVGGDQVKSGKTIIRLAYEEQLYYQVTELTEKVRDFNLTSDEYRVELCPYNTDDISGANEKLRLDMVAGKIPDIIFFSLSLTAEDFIRYNALADLYEFMDKDEKYTRDAFVPCVRNAAETKSGKLPYLIMDYGFTGFAGRTSVIGEKTSYTIDDFAELISGLGRDQYIAYSNKTDPKSALLNTLLPYMMNSFIDYDKGKCNFGDGLEKLIELSGTAPVLIGGEYEYDAPIEDLRSGRVLLGEIGYANPVKRRGEEIISFGGDDVTYIGYPQNGEAKENTVMWTVTSFGIAKQSRKQEAAWDFLCWCLDEQIKDYQDKQANPKNASVNYLPPTWEGIDEAIEMMSMVEYACKPFVNKSSGALSGCWLSTVYIDQSTKEGRMEYSNEFNKVRVQGGAIVKLTDEDIARLKHLLENVSIVNSTDTATMNIIKEEASAYFAGAQTLERTVEIITDRVQTRLSE